MMTTARLMLITIIGTLAYLDLAILGSGGLGQLIWSEIVSELCHPAFSLRSVRKHWCR
jgi:hypothetical protein